MTLFSDQIQQGVINIGFFIFMLSTFLFMLSVIMGGISRRSLEKQNINKFCEIRDCLSNAEKYIKNTENRNFIHLISKFMRENARIPDELELDRLDKASKGVKGEKEI